MSWSVEHFVMALAAALLVFLLILTTFGVNSESKSQLTIRVGLEDHFITLSSSFVTLSFTQQSPQRFKSKEGQVTLGYRLGNGLSLILRPAARDSGHILEVMECSSSYGG